MCFNVEALRTMLLEIEERHQDRWWKIIVDIANQISAGAAFSEYETYANWFALRHGPHTEIPIHIFRRGDLLVGSTLGTVARLAKVISKVEAKGYDAVAFELNHSGGVLRSLAAWTLLKFAIKKW